MHLYTKFHGANINSERETSDEDYEPDQDNELRLNSEGSIGKEGSDLISNNTEPETDEEGEESSSSEEESNDGFDLNDSDDDVKKKGFMAKKAPPKRKAPAGRGRGGALKMPTALTGELSEYEKIRQGNIAEREEMLKELIADFDSFKKDSGIGVAKKAPLKKRNRVETV